MSNVIYCKKTSITSLLHHWIAQKTTPEAVNWLSRKREQISNCGISRDFFTAFSAVSRHIGKNQLHLPPKDLKAASALKNGWVPSHWSVDQAARTLLLLALPQDNPEIYLHTLEQVFATADIGELIALYQALPLLPYPERLQKLAAEGVRSNMTAVFNAIALRNPYPAHYLDTLAWNQMVLKALFVGSPLHFIHGLDFRANRELARMLIDYIHERQSANRSVPAGIWRLVGKFADAAILVDLQRAIADPDPIQQAAAALACADCPLPQAQILLASYPNLQKFIDTKSLTWKSLSPQL
ncbi:MULTISPECIES: EboA family metabolite traffic protein [unclassified Anabaena]|uniref:EboA family metabolite traffic protein n=1 Tax=unclassified Anabaena TaxID=2619674 RepID=UPI0039C5CBB4